MYGTVTRPDNHLPAQISDNQPVQTYSFFFLCFFVLHRAFLYFLCTVSGCDEGNRTRNIAVYTWRFSLLSYGRHPLSYGRHPLSYDRHPLSYGRHPMYSINIWYGSALYNHTAVPVLYRTIIIWLRRRFYISHLSL